MNTLRAESFPCPRCGESLPAGYSRCDACGAYVVSAPTGAAAPHAPPKSAVRGGGAKQEPKSAVGNAWLFLVIGLAVGGAIGYALQGAVGPRGEGGMPTGPSDIIRGATGAGGDAGGAMGGGAMGGGASPPQMPPQVAAMVQEYRQALARDPNDVQANIGFGNLLFDSGQWEKAVDHYGRALAKTPENADVRVDRAIALHNLNRNEEALKELGRVTREHPAHLNAWLNTGVIAATLGDRAGAIRAWEQYLKLSPNGQHSDAIRAQIEELKKGS